MQSHESKFMGAIMILTISFSIPTSAEDENSIRWDLIQSVEMTRV